jgi:hypothetical protein
LQIFASFDDEFSGCMTVMTALAVNDGKTLYVMSSSCSEHDDVLFGDTDPKPRTPQPTARIDASFASHCQPRLSAVDFGIQEFTF